MKKTFGWAVVCAFLVPGMARAADDGTEKIIPRSGEELQTRIREVLARTKTPAVGYAVFTREGVELAAGVGKADVAEGRDATSDTLFRIGSISKMFVGLSALLLQEESRLRLEDTFRSHAPEIAFENPWESTEPVRLVHLLEHTTGFDDLTLREYAHGRELRLKEALDYEPRSRRSRWRPGTRFSYCNSGPPMVAYVIEKLSGRRFEDFVGERLFFPLGMTTASYFRPAPEKAATLYHADGTTPFPYWEILVRPSGSINASPAELAHLGMMLLNRGSYGGRVLLPEAAVDRLERPTTTYAARAGLATGYGLGNYASFGGGLELHGHDGGVEGGLATLAYSRDAGVGFVALINSGSGEALDDVSHLLRNYATRDEAKPVPAAAVRMSEAVARDYAGWYVPDSPRQETTRFLERLFGVTRVHLEGEKLRFLPLLGEERTYVAVSEGAFRREEHPAASLALLDTPEGRLIQTPQTLRRAPSAGVIAQIALAGATVALMLSAPLFALVWIPRWLFGRLRHAPHLRARALTLATVVSILGAFSLIALAGEDVIGRFGRPTPWALAFCGLTVLFAVLAPCGLWLALRVPVGGTNRVARWHSILVSAANVLGAAYLGYWGIIGLRTWS